MDHVVLRLWHLSRGRPWWRSLDAWRLFARSLRRPWALREWVESVETHDRIVAGGPAVLRMPPLAKRMLWHARVGERRLQLMVCRRGAFDGRGEFQLELMDGEGCVASIAFTFALSGTDKVAHAQQASTTPEAAGLTTALQGMSADSFVRAAFRALCCCLGVVHILGMADDESLSFELDVPLDPAKQARHELLGRVCADISIACGQSYAPTAPLVRLHAA